MQSEKFTDFLLSLEVWQLFCVSFYSVAVYNSVVTEFCPLSLKQRIKLVLVSKTQDNAIILLK